MGKGGEGGGTGLDRYPHGTRLTVVQYRFPTVHRRYAVTGGHTSAIQTDAIDLLRKFWSFLFFEKVDDWMVVVVDPLVAVGRGGG